MNTHNTLSLPTLSRMDEDLIRLHQHRLVKPGMNMSEIERLIVFREDLLDSPPPRELDGYELVRSAFGRLQDADRRGSDERRMEKLEMQQFVWMGGLRNRRLRSKLCKYHSF